MSHTLCLRVRAPMMSFGTSSRFSIRDTGKEPSKSGMIGLLCVALGISRDEANTANEQFLKLTELKMGIRVLREGIMQKDYQTAQNIATAAAKQRKDGTYETKPTELSIRWYLADADFVVGLEGERALLESLHDALLNPKWQLFLGRKSFPASVPVHFVEGVFDGAFDNVLKSPVLTDLLAAYNSRLGLKEHENGLQRLVLDDPNGTELRQDVPLDFAARRFTIRRVTTTFISPTGGEKDDGDIPDEDDT